jgi:K+-transporting ATPase KdpF subunit
MRSTIPAIMTPVLAIATIVACGLAVYLVVAMLAPERFS